MDKNLTITNKGLALVFAVIFSLAGCSLLQSGRFEILDAKTTTAIDENLEPVIITDSFPDGTTKVFCWMRWQNAKINTQIMTKWHFVTDDVHIVDHPFIITKKDGSGSVELAMSEGKVLPPGLYKIDILLGKRILRTLNFKIEQ